MALQIYKSPYQQSPQFHSRSSCDDDYDDVGSSNDDDGNGNGNNDDNHSNSSSSHSSSGSNSISISIDNDDDDNDNEPCRVQSTGSNEYFCHICSPWIIISVLLIEVVAMVVVLIVVTKGKQKKGLPVEAVFSGTHI